MPDSVAGLILVTGASTGIGRAITERLASAGLPVLAGARKEKDLEALRQLPNVTPLRLDVTNPDDVLRAASSIRSSGAGLSALVNNAGVGTMGPLVEITVDELHRASSVALDGMHRMVGAMFPFLRESRGRIVNISSVAGFLVEPFFGPYNLSKHEVEIYSDLLREEVAPFGVKVISVEPGAFQTNIYANGVAAMGDGVRARWERSIYRDQLLAAWDRIVDDPDVLYRRALPKPDAVADAVARALSAKEPRPRYLVCSREEAEAIVDRMFGLLREMRELESLGLTRAELRARFEKALQ